MMYAYKCRICGARFDSTSRHLTSCPECLNRNIGRDYSSVQFGGGLFKPHFNHAVGSYVSSSRDFDEKLKIKGEEAGTTFGRLDPGDQPRPTVDDHIFDTQMKTIRDNNIDPGSLI
jgi:hypothetical protein